MAGGSTSGVIEARSIEVVPDGERHGTPVSQFTLWFGATTQVTAVVDGALAVVFGADPIWAIIGLLIGNLLGGAVIVEIVFAWPGIGRLLVDAIEHRDYPLVQATILLITATFIVINFVVDLSYGYLDPRIRLR